MKSYFSIFVEWEHLSPVVTGEAPVPLWGTGLAVAASLCICPLGTRKAFSALEDDRDRNAGPWGLCSAPQPQQAHSHTLHRGVCYTRHRWPGCRDRQQVSCWVTVESSSLRSNKFSKLSWEFVCFDFFPLMTDTYQILRYYLILKLWQYPYKC